MSLSPPAAVSRLSTYMITGDADEITLVRQVEHALRLGVDYIQLRRKSGTARSLERLALRLASLGPDARRRILVNGRLDVALGAALAGVHLASDGLPAEAVRRCLPANFLVVCSTHSRAEAEAAARAGASFVVFGPVFPTRSKPGHPGVGVEALSEVAAAVDLPVYALGGVTTERLPRIAASGARGVAGISAFESRVSLEAMLARCRALSG
jgi:thiamine-phosphate pyrophosphorylase